MEFFGIDFNFLFEINYGNIRGVADTEIVIFKTENFSWTGGEFSHKIFHRQNSGMNEFFQTYRNGCFKTDDTEWRMIEFNQFCSCCMRCMVGGNNSDRTICESLNQCLTVFFSTKWQRSAG